MKNIKANIKNEVLKYAKRAFSEGLFTGTSGNLSFFEKETGLIYITPSSMRYEDMEQEDIAVIGIDGKSIDAKNKPSSEWRLHTEIYKSLDDVCAVVHTHSPYATAFAVNREAIPGVLVEFGAFLGGEVECALFAKPGTEELAKKTVPFLKGKGGCLMANHGVVAIGKDIKSAFANAEYIENGAKVCAIARSIEKHL